MDVKPDSFDWVTARSRCSLDKSFQILSEIVSSNVKTANGLVKLTMNFEYKSLDRKFMVIRTRDMAGVNEISSVVFELSLATIDVRRLNSRGAEMQTFSAKPSFTEDGDCVFEVGAQSLKLWQISKLALDDLFFSRR
jgi:hypothetical protein